MRMKTHAVPSPEHSKPLAVVIGDSWSCRDLWNVRSPLYGVELSLAARLERKGYSVICFAQQGASQLSQFEHVLTWQRLNGDLAPPQLALVGWTDWARDRAAAHTLSRTKDQRRVAQLAQQQLDTIAEAWPTTQFMHWGGQSPVWPSIRLSEPQHTILSWDWGREVLALPARSDSYFTWSAGCANTRAVETALAQLKWTSTDLSQRLILDELEHGRTLALSTHSHPDGGHLAWSYYDGLMARAWARLRSPAQQ